MGSGGSSSVKQTITTNTSICTNVMMSMATYHTVAVSQKQGISTVGSGNVYNNVDMHQQLQLQISLSNNVSQLTAIQNTIAAALQATASASSEQGTFGSGGQSNVETNMQINTNVQTNITQSFITQITETINQQQFITTVGDNNIYSSVAMTQLQTYATETIASAIGQTSLANESKTAAEVSGSAKSISSMTAFGNAMSGIIGAIGGIFSGAILMVLLVVMLPVIIVVLLLCGCCSGKKSAAAGSAGSAGSAGFAGFAGSAGSAAAEPAAVPVRPQVVWDVHMPTGEVYKRTAAELRQYNESLQGTVPQPMQDQGSQPMCDRPRLVSATNSQPYTASNLNCFNVTGDTVEKTGKLVEQWQSDEYDALPNLDNVVYTNVAGTRSGLYAVVLCNDCKGHISGKFNNQDLNCKETGNMVSGKKCVILRYICNYTANPTGIIIYSSIPGTDINYNYSTPPECIIAKTYEEASTMFEALKAFRPTTTPELKADPESDIVGQFTISNSELTGNKIPAKDWHRTAYNNKVDAQSDTYTGLGLDRLDIYATVFYNKTQPPECKIKDITVKCTHIEGLGENESYIALQQSTNRSNAIVIYENCDKVCANDPLYIIAKTHNEARSVYTKVSECLSGK